MKIEGDTIIFRSDWDNFTRELEGHKTSTIRWFSLEEETEFFHHKENIKKIRIQSGKSDAVCFERILTDATNIGWILNMRLWIFSWKHKKEE